MIRIFRDAPWLFLHSEVQVTAVRREVQGFLVHPTERYLAYKARLNPGAHWLEWKRG